MNIAVYGIQFNKAKIQIFEDLFTYLNSFQEVNTVSIYKPFFEILTEDVPAIGSFPSFDEKSDIANFDMMICLGGDGAILDTLCVVKDSGVPVLGINTGRLGFLSGISTEKIKNPLQEVLAGAYSIDKRSVLKMIDNENLFGEVNYALNEITVQKKDSSSMMIIHAYADDEYLNSYWADGLIISTPTGSTGYNLSCSGPIIMPGSNVFVVTPIAPHNLNVRPLIIPNDKKITLKLEGRDDECLIALDSRSRAVKTGTSLDIVVGEFQMNIVRPEDHSFLQTLRNKLAWGLDARN